MKKSRVGADMEISSTEALRNAKLEVDRALDKANKTLHRLLEENPLESDAVTKAAELKSIRDKRVHRRHDDQLGAETTQGTTCAGRLRGRREGRKRCHQLDDDSISENATLLSSGPQKRRLHSVHS